MPHQMVQVTTGPRAMKIVDTVRGDRSGQLDSWVMGSQTALMISGSPSKCVFTPLWLLSHYPLFQRPLRMSSEGNLDDRLGSEPAAAPVERTEL